MTKCASPSASRSDRWSGWITVMSATRQLRTVARLLVRNARIAVVVYDDVIGEDFEAATLLRPGRSAIACLRSRPQCVRAGFWRAMQESVPELVASVLSHLAPLLEPVVIDLAVGALHGRRIIAAGHARRTSNPRADRDRARILAAPRRLRPAFGQCCPETVPATGHRTTSALRARLLCELRLRIADRDDRRRPPLTRCARRSSSSSRLFGQSSLSSRDSERSASSLPSVWQVAQ